MTFGRLIYIDRLKEAGVSESVARAHAEALRDALFETVATKADLTEAVQATRADLKEAVQATRADLKEAVQTTKTDLKEAVHTLDDAVQALDRKIESSAETLDRKIEITARDLTIKGAGGLIVIASIIVGLKLFG